MPLGPLLLLAVVGRAGRGPVDLVDVAAPVGLGRPGRRRGHVVVHVDGVLHPAAAGVAVVGAQQVRDVHVVVVVVAVVAVVGGHAERVVDQALFIVYLVLIFMELERENNHLLFLVFPVAWLVAGGLDGPGGGERPLLDHAAPLGRGRVEEAVATGVLGRIGGKLFQRQP